MTIHIGDQEVQTNKTFEASLTSEAWDRYNKFEQQMVNFGVESGTPEIYTPTLDRLSKSTLKAAVLLAASQTTSKVEVDLPTMLQAIKYAESWAPFSLDVVANAGKTGSEKQLDIIYKTIQRSTEGVLRSRVMQNYHLTAREADWILQTLDQRGLIRRVKDGKTERLFATYVRS